MLTIRRDDDHTDAHDLGLYFAAEPFDHEADLLRRTEGPVLDVGCGAGRMLLWLQQRGMAAVGIDVSPGAVEVCRTRGCADVRLIDVMEARADALGEGAFRTAVVFGNNIGIGGTIEGARELLWRLARAVAPSGHLLVAGLDITQTAEPQHLAYHRRNRAAGRPRGEIVMRFEYEGGVGSWVRWFHPEPEELERIALEAGWTIVEIGSAAGPFLAAVLQRQR